MILFDDALVFAMKKHEGQKRLDGENYINHPFRVHDAVCNDGKESDICSIAVLHDTLEDTDTTYDELLDKFGSEITSAVVTLSKAKTISYEQYIENIRASNNPKIIKVKIADLKDNLSTIDNILDPEKRTRLKNRYEKALKELTDKK